MPARAGRVRKGPRLLVGDVKPRYYDCLTSDVAVKVTGCCGFEFWLCAKDWQIQQDFAAAIDAVLKVATRV